MKRIMLLSVCFLALAVHAVYVPGTNALEIARANCRLPEPQLTEFGPCICCMARAEEIVKMRIKNGENRRRTSRKLDPFKPKDAMNILGKKYPAKDAQAVRLGRPAKNGGAK